MLMVHDLEQHNIGPPPVIPVRKASLAVAFIALGAS